MADNTWDKISNNMNANKKLHDRMGVTEGIAYMDDYHLRKWKGEKASKVINVTGNKGSSYLHRIISSLIAQKRQLVVEGDISGAETHRIEKFLKCLGDQTDVYLQETYGIPNLHSYLCNHVCVRGPIGVMWMSWLEGDTYKIHCFPLDMRYTAFVLNRWVAPISYISKDDLEADLEVYEKKAKDGRQGEYHKIHLTKTSDNEVRDYWDYKGHELWIEGRLVWTEKNITGDLPSVIVFPSAGYLLRSKGYMEHEGEDALFLARKLEEEINRIISVEQSFLFRQLVPASEYETDEEDATPAEPLPEAGETKKRRKGELHKIIPTGDMNLASQFANRDIFAMMDAVAPYPKSYPQAPSGVEITAEVELSNQLQQSRIEAMQALWSQLSTKQIKQFIKVTEKHKGELTIGKRGRRESFTSGQIKDPELYSIDCQFTGRNKKLEIVNIALARSVWDIAPRKYVLRHIWQVEDPDGWERALELQQARDANPALSLLDMSIRYAEEAQEMADETDKKAKILQSKILQHDYVMAMRQRFQPPQSQPETSGIKIPEQTGNANALVSLLGPGGMGGEVLGQGQGQGQGKIPREVRE